jgi:hypothetical protein
MAEDDEQTAHVVLQEGLEQAIRKKEAAGEAYPPYVPDAETGEEEQAVAQVAHQITKADHVTATEKAWAVE